MSANALYYGDNLKILREHIPDESVDLIYLDPPFNSKATYNVLFKERTGEGSAAQIKAFEDTWHWGEEAERAYAEILASPLASSMTKEIVASLRRALGERNDMTAYLAMMAVRLLELRRVLKPTGSLYLHCDPTASHYLKIVLDTIFGARNFRNEITWKRTHAHSGAKKFGAVHDILLFYAKSEKCKWNKQQLDYSQNYVETFFRFEEPDGRRYRATILTGSGTRTGSSGKPWRGIDPTASGRHWAIPGYIRPLLGDLDFPDVQSALDELDKIGRILWPAKPGGVPSFKQYQDDMGGTDLQDVWPDIPPISAQAKERLGYATQKPLALLERIISASSNEGDVVLDPFCGCGTAVAAAHKLKRQWIGIDVTHLAVALMKHRLKDMFGLEPYKDYKVIGEPADVGGAQQLAKEDRERHSNEFQYWALSLIEARPEEPKKGADRGVDGTIFFLDGPQRTAHKAVIQVKSGHVSSPQIRDLKGVLEREKAALGLFISLEDPTRDMRTEAASAGFFHSDLMDRDYPRLQIRTIGELLESRGFEMPLRPVQFQQAPRARRREGVQGSMLEGRSL
ncbi:MAG: restriction endonuclease [Chloroflexi bacterium]|nr:restriction endonuclease [Chloroflexota bacterium]